MFGTVRRACRIRVIIKARRGRGCGLLVRTVARATRVCQIKERLSNLLLPLTVVRQALHREEFCFTTPSETTELRSEVGLLGSSWLYVAR